MKPATVTVVLACAGVCSLATAQTSHLGTYTGSFIFPSRSGDTSLGVTLAITKIDEAGAVEGMARLNTRGPCAGEYPMQGKLLENQITMKETQRAGRAGDCGFSFNGTIEGNKIVGTTGGGRALQLSK